MSGEGKGTKISPFPAARGLASVPTDTRHRPHKLQSQIDAKRATAAEMRHELERVTEELRSAMHVVRNTDTDDPEAERPEHPQIKQRALLMVRVALEDAIVCLEDEADKLEAEARNTPQ